jgi:hypothetical protein
MGAIMTKSSMFSGIALLTGAGAGAGPFVPTGQ